MTTIEAVTFDFWDTIAIDDSDEAKRRKLGLPSKSQARTELFAEIVTAHHPEIDRASAAEAYGHANQRFNSEWHGEHRTPNVATRIWYAYEYLGLYCEPLQYASLVREIGELVRMIEEMEIRIPPDFAQGIHAVLAELATEYKLGIISDTIHTNGKGLRHLLAQQNILRYFRYFVFSNEIGLAKPSSEVFRQAAIGLNTPPSQIVHIGDRESNDIKGPQAMGMKAILYTGIKDRRDGTNEQTRANAVCSNYRDLPRLIKQLR